MFVSEQILHIMMDNIMATDKIYAVKKLFRLLLPARMKLGIIPTQDSDIMNTLVLQAYFNIYKSPARSIS